MEPHLAATLLTRPPHYSGQVLKIQKYFHDTEWHDTYTLYAIALQH